MVDEGAPLVGLAAVVVRCADDDVRKTVTVDVTRRVDRHAEVCAGLIAFGEPRWRCAQPGARSREDRCDALGCFAVGLVGNTDHDVGVAVAVDVARRCHRIAELVLGSGAVHGPRRGCAEADCRSVVHEGAAAVDCAAVVAGSTDDHVGVAVAVDVPRGGQGPPEIGGVLVGLRAPAVRVPEAGGRAEVDPGPALPAIVSLAAHDQIADAVAVDVAGRRQSASKLLIAARP